VSVEVKNYVTGEVEEKLYAGSSTIAKSTTTPASVLKDSVPAGYDAVAVSVACSQDSDVSFWLKIAGKQVYDNGLNTAGLAGLTEETLLLVKIDEKKDFEVGFTNVNSTTDKTVNWRFRVRLFRK
jgi:hypothetical protein